MKKFDLAVKTGSYEKNGEIKNRYQNVGVMIEGNNGPYILLNKTFNPAGIQDGKGSVLIHMFEEKDAQGGFAADDSEIPF